MYSEEAQKAFSVLLTFPRFPRGPGGFVPVQLPVGSLFQLTYAR